MSEEKHHMEMGGKTYAQTEKELLTIAFGCQRCRQYIIARRVVVGRVRSSNVRKYI